MVKIRYVELPAGLHVTTEDRGGCAIVYLLPGLTPPQRRAALTFARRSARIGHGPSLPPVDMAFALAADRARTSGRTIGAVLRRHPTLLLPLVAVVSGVIVATMLSFVTVSMTPVKGPATGQAPQGTGGSTTPTPFGEPTSAGQLAVRSPRGSASASGTPSVRGAAAEPAAGRLCVILVRTTICMRL
ncbi:MAG: hypothetical protein ACRDOK_12130 [Streptosporangiaceae bacterium]